MLDRLHYAKAADPRCTLPCAWMTVMGRCKKGDKCRKCHPGGGKAAVEPDAALLRKAKAACATELLDSVLKPDTAFGRC